MNPDDFKYKAIMECLKDDGCMLIEGSISKFPGLAVVKNQRETEEK